MDEEENDEDATAFSDEEMGQFSFDGEEEQESSDSEDEKEVQSETMNFPTFIRFHEWTSSNLRPLDSFSSIHGGDLFYTNRWDGSRELCWTAARVLVDAQRSLADAARIEDRHSITLEYKAKYLSQVPYRKFHFGSPFCISYATRC